MLRKTILLNCLAFLVAWVPFSASWAEEGVTDTEIRIGSFGPLTGPAKLWGGTLWGTDLAFDFVNKQGGIHGRKIDYHMVDDSYNPAKTKAFVKRTAREKFWYVKCQRQLNREPQGSRKNNFTFSGADPSRLTALLVG